MLVTLTGSLAREIVFILVLLVLYVTSRNLSGERSPVRRARQRTG